MTGPSMEQRRAANAYSQIANAQGESLEMARKLPSMLQINGLLATWAFLIAKAGGANLLRALVAHLATVPRLPFPGPGLSDTETDAKKIFLTWVGHPAGNEMTGNRMRQVTAEALAFAGWLKRAVEAQGETAEGLPAEEEADV